MHKLQISIPGDSSEGYVKLDGSEIQVTEMEVRMQAGPVCEVQIKMLAFVEMTGDLSVREFKRDKQKKSSRRRK